MTGGPENKVEMREIPASEILDKIRLGVPVDYPNVIVKGSLDVRKLNLKTENGKLLVESPIKITNSRIDGGAFFANSIFMHQINLESTNIGGMALFGGVTFRGNVRFIKTSFGQHANFNGATFERSDKTATFNKATFNGDAFFQKATFCGDADFSGVTFIGTADFNCGTKFRRIAKFYRAVFTEYVGFIDATFSEDALFHGATFNGDILTFRNAVFGRESSQENACRRAKNVLEKSGDREEAGYHFYREMDGKRKQKPWYYRYPEFVAIQVIAGYGVHPWRLFYWWLLFISIFSNIYLIGDGIEGIEHWYDYIKISFAIAIAPGYIAAIINPASAGYKLIPIYQAVAVIETIVGTLLWAGFIATFAKKYMK